VSPEDLQNLLAMESAYVRAFRQAQGTPGFELVEEPGLVRTQSCVPVPWFNCVLSTQLPETQQRATIQRLVALYGAQRLPLLWRLGPATTGRASLGEALQEAGFHKAPPSTAILGRIPLLIHLWEVLPVPVQGVLVSNREDYQRWFDIFSQSFGVPREHRPFFEEVAFAGEAQNLLLLKDGEPVACATTWWRPGEAFASIFNFAVAPEHRASGLGKYMLGFAALRLRQQGCRQIGQFSTAAGAPFYLTVTPARRLGDFDNWIRMPQS
jgi:GNAT superfamily N-acetyltransferase